jgi:hypothetical protein
VTKGFFQDVSLWPKDLSIQPVLPLRKPEERELDAWSIHFRIGDYQILPHHQFPLGPYYRTCLEKIPKSAKLVLFSDSPEKLEGIRQEIVDAGWARERVEISHANDEEETLQEFMKCQGGSICSNSTFAWWAAWFTWRATGQRSTYIATFPTPWVHGHPAPKIFDLPFTQAIDLSSIPPSLTLHSFPFH